MGNEQFEQVINRKGTYSAKWDTHALSTDIIPLSVADMDFAAPPGVISELAAFNQKGVYGYTLLSHHWNNILVSWLSRHYQWKIDPDWNLFCPRVIQAIALYLQNFTAINDRIVTLAPSYGPINHLVTANQRILVESELIYSQGEYQINFDDLDNKLTHARCFILLSPHNPTGIVWKRWQLEKICQLAEKHNVFIISDDVHADFTFNGSHYFPISQISDYALNNSMICTSPAKTFNLAGLEIANIIIADSTVREVFKRCLDAAGIHNPGYFSVPAFLYAYQYADDWLRHLKEYIYQNKIYVRHFLLTHFVGLSIPDTDGTYLLWVNYHQLKITESQLMHWFLECAGVDVSLGTSFGSAGNGFFRINVATPRVLLERALQRIWTSSLSLPIEIRNRIVR